MGSEDNFGCLFLPSILFVTEYRCHSLLPKLGWLDHSILGRRELSCLVIGNTRISNMSYCARLYVGSRDLKSRYSCL